MHIDEIKKEISKKIVDIYNNMSKTDAQRDALIKAMKANGDWTKDLSEEELEETSPSFAADKKKLRETIKDLLRLSIETKYNLIPVLRSWEKKWLRTAGKSHMIEEEIERHLEQSFITQRENMKKRINELKAVYLDVVIEPRIRDLYREMVSCYVQGNLNASSVLCRAIAELVAKDHIKTSGLGHLLKRGISPNKQKMSIPNILKNKLSMPDEVVGIYSKIASKGDLILHERDKKTEEKEALNSIAHLQSFIKKLPKRL